MFDRKRFRLATAVILFLLLTIALAPVAAAAPNPPPPDPPANGDTVTPPPPPTGGDTVVTPPPPEDDGNNGTGTVDPPPPDVGNGETTDSSDGDGEMMTPSAPSWPPSQLIVAHAATQVQLTSVGDGLQTYFIGTDGTGHSGPYIDSFSNLAQLHSTGGAVTLFTGTNPGTGKGITIYYLPTEQKVRISTYYPDNEYDTNKPYVFTIDSGHNVTHDQW